MTCRSCQLKVIGSCLLWSLHESYWRRKTLKSTWKCDQQSGKVEIWTLLFIWSGIMPRTYILVFTTVNILWYTAPVCLHHLSKSALYLPLCPLSVYHPTIPFYVFLFCPDQDNLFFDSWLITMSSNRDADSFSAIQWNCIQLNSKKATWPLWC